MRISPAIYSKLQKGRAALLAAALLLCTLTGCGGSGALALPQSPRLAVVDAGGGSGEVQMPDVSSLLTAAEELGLDALQGEADPESLALLAEEEGITAAAILISRPQQAEAYITAAGELGLPLIFLGARPADSAMESYDKCWYLGTNPEGEGEQLGEALFDFWLGGQIADRSANKLLDVLVVTSGSETDSRADAVLRIFENYGVYGADPVFLPIDTGAGEDPAAMVGAQLTLSGGADLVLVTDPSLVPQLLDACAAAGVPMAVFGEPEEAAALLDGGTLLACSSFDAQSAAALTVSFADNVSRGRDATDGTGQRLDEQRCALLPVEVKTTDAGAAAAPAEAAAPQESSSNGGSNG